MKTRPKIPCLWQWRSWSPLGFGGSNSTCRGRGFLDTSELPSRHGHFLLHDALWGQFRIPNHAKVELRNLPEEDGCWFNVSFPRFNAKLHCTEVPVTDLGPLLQDAQSLVFGHEVAATGIRRQALDLPSKSGMLYALEGPVATSLQFFVTDSVDHFMRGRCTQPQAQPGQRGARS